MTLNVKELLSTPNFNSLLSCYRQKAGVGLKSHSKSYSLIILHSIICTWSKMSHPYIIYCYPILCMIQGFHEYRYKKREKR